jgi:hypothetical protein
MVYDRHWLAGGDDHPCAAASSVQAGDPAMQVVSESVSALPRMPKVTRSPSRLPGHHVADTTPPCQGTRMPRRSAVIVFNVAKEQHGWAIRMGETMMTPFWSRQAAVREAHCLAASLRLHGAMTKVLVEPEAPAQTTTGGANPMPG